MPSIGPSQLTRSTRFHAILISPPATVSRWKEVPPNRRCSLRRNSISTNLDRTSVDAAFGVLLDADIGDDPAGARSRLLRIDARAREPAYPRLQKLPVVVDQRDRVQRARLVRLAWNPVSSVRREQRQPVVEFPFIQQARFMQQKKLALADVEPLHRSSLGTLSTASCVMRHAGTLSTRARCLGAPAAPI